MQHYKLVLPEHLNHYGFLFGGYMLHWIDEVAYITATIDFPEHEFVTVAMDNVSFKQKVLNGEVLKFDVRKHKIGNSSVEYMIQVFGETRSKRADTVLFETSMTFVCIGEDGEKRTIESE
ncbi:MAG: acyl-CoA thioesterase [Sinobacterium sp.]|nr:acyl-CoA thioesterase [Sinobacterium sp.]